MILSYYRFLSVIIAHYAILRYTFFQHSQHENFIKIGLQLLLDH